MAPKTLATLILVAGLSGCNWYYNTLPSPDDLVKLVPWFDHMVKSPVVSPYSRLDVPRLTPKGTVPITGGEADWGTGNLTGPVPTYGFDTVTANRLVKPEAGVGNLHGDSLYTTFCLVCHGATGNGKGPVGIRLGAKSLLTDLAKGYSDGYLYSIIKYGRGVMPLYGDKIYRPVDRWSVVNYVRQLQASNTGAAQ